MSWGGLNNALTAWRSAVMARFPKKDTASDGARADAAHGSTSQHQPDSDGTVDAYDMDVNLQHSAFPAGSSAELRLLEAMKLDFERDPRARGQLWIHMGEIANRDHGNWSERVYSGANPHDKHVHWQSRQDREDDGSAWPMPHTDALLREMEGDDVTKEEIAAGVALFFAGAAAAATDQAPAGPEGADERNARRSLDAVMDFVNAMPRADDATMRAIGALSDQLTQVTERLSEIERRLSPPTAVAR